MNGDLITALISFFTSSCVNAVSLIGNYSMGKKERNNALSLNAQNTVLNPLRNTVVDSIIRMDDVIKKTHSTNNPLSFLNKVEDILNQSDKWFYSDGNYICSTSYLLGCLIARLHIVKEQLPVLYLTDKNYKSIIRHIVVIEEVFRRNYNIFHVIQYDIGNSMTIGDGNRVISFSEFCKKIRSKEEYPVFYKLIEFVIRVKDNMQIYPELKADLESLYNDLNTVLGIKEKLDDYLIVSPK